MKKKTATVVVDGKQEALERVRCTRAEFCSALSKAFNFQSSRRGIICHHMYGGKNFAPKRKVAAYYGGDFKKGIVMNFCPFCGKKIDKVKLVKEE